MKFLKYLEKAWMFAAIASVAVAVFNGISQQTVSYPFYFPLLCSGFCTVLYFNVRGQRRFQESMKNKAEGGAASKGR